MKYNLHINQKQAIELGIKNFNQAHIFDLISMSASWAEPVSVDGEVYYWVARQKIITELPLMDIKPDTAYRHLKSLVDLGLIEHIKHGVKDLVRLTDLGKTYHSNTMSEKNPSKVGKKSENNSEKNPTYTTTNKHNTTKDTDIREKPKKKRFVKPTAEQINDYLKENNNDNKIDAEYFIDYYESKDWMVGKSRMKDWKATVRNWLRREQTGENNGNNKHAETPAERINRQGREYDEKMRQRQNAMDMGAYETRISGTLD